MNPERNIIASCIKSRDAYRSLVHRINPEENAFSDVSQMLWREVHEYYDRDPAADAVDPELLISIVSSNLNNPKIVKNIETYINELVHSECSPQNVVHDYIETCKQECAHRLSVALSTKDEEATAKLLEEYERWSSNDLDDARGDGESVLRATDVADLVSNYTSNNVMELYPLALNSKLDGGLLRGNHVIVFARPEAGKTLFLVNASAGFLRQGLRVLYVGNEDPIEDIALRLLTRLLGKTKKEIMEQPAKAHEAAMKRGYEDIIFASLAPGTPWEIKRLVKKYEPDVVIIDQLRNLYTGEKNYVQKLEQVATEARNIAKSCSCVVVSATQAGDSGHNKSNLDMGDIDYSNTGIPAQADVMIGIGATEQDLEQNIRTLSLPKNKRSGDHTPLHVQVDPILNKVLAVN